MDINIEKSMEEAILETAERLFLENGYASTSTTQIAKEVGCNQALVHYYFRTKENLFNTIFEKKFKAFFQQIFDMNHLENLSFLDKLKKIIETHFDLISQNPQIPQLIISELPRQPEQIKSLKEKLYSYPESLFAQLGEELQVEIAAGRVRNVDLTDIIITIVSLNAALFTFLPIVASIVELDENERKSILAHRKIEHVNIVMSYLRP